MTLPRACLLSLVLTLAALPAAGQQALDGLDVVSLRDSGRTVAGDGAIATRWKGRSWVFANEANRAAFEADPRAYVPVFGGNCPVALAEGHKRAGSPEFAVVVKGKLYLTHDAGARDRLRQDAAPILHRAAEAWAKQR